MKNTSDFTAFTAFSLGDNMLHIEMKKVSKLSAEDVREINNCYKKIGENGGAYVLVTFDGFIPLSMDAMGEASKKSSQKYIRSMAYVIRSSAIRIGVNFFFMFYKTKYPSEVFKSRSEAIGWLKQRMKEDSKKK